MSFSRRISKVDGNSRAPVHVLELLEGRFLLSAAFDITGLTALRNNPAFSQITGSGVGVAVLDTGVDAKNPDLSSNVVAFYNAVADPVNTTDVSVANAIDHDGHGSHVSGIAASSNPSIGVAYKAKLVDIRVIPDSGESQLGGDPVLRGLEWVANNYLTYNIKIVNMSLGESGVNDNTVTAADARDAEAVEIQSLQKLGITVVTASGNSYGNDPTPGASFPAVVSTISVANTWASTGQQSDFGVPFGGAGDQYYAVDYSATADTLASTSQRSTLPNQVAAPGEDIYSTWNGTQDSSNGSDLLHNTISGTSMAAPFVSGVVALMQNAAKYFGGHYLSDTNQILQIIQQTADPIVDSNNPNNARYNSLNGATSNLPETGLSYKRVDVLKAIEEVESLVTGGAVTTGPTPGPDTDNTASTATPVNSIDGTTIFTFDGSIGSDGLVLDGTSDVDLYKLDVVSPGSISITLSQPAGGTAFAAELRLFNSSGTQLGSATGTANTYPTLATAANTPLPIGTYYLGISSVGNAVYTINGAGATGGTSQGDYTLQIELQNPDPNGTIQGASAVDLTQTTEILQDPNSAAQVTDVLQSGELGSDPPPAGSITRINVNSDVDMFKMVAPDTGKIDVTTDTSSYLLGADTYLKVYDQNLNLIASNDDASVFTTDSALTVSVTAGQTYYVAVTVPANANFDPNDPYANRAANATPSNEFYDLHLRFDNGDTNGTAVSAANATIGTDANGTIGADNGVALLGANGGNKDVDWLSYTANSSGLFDITASPTTSGFTPVLSLWEFTAGQTDIVKVADTSTLSSAHLIAQVSPGESFFVAVTGMGNNDFDWFSVASGSGGQTGSYTISTTLRSASDLSTLSDNAIQDSPQAITIGQQIKGNLGMDANVVIGASDVDMYKLVAPATELLDIRTSTSQEGDADTVLRVFDANGNQIAINDNINSSTTASDVKISVQAGQTYYIGVSGAGVNSAAYNPNTGVGAGDGSTGNYAVSVSTAVAGLSVSNAPDVVGFAGNFAQFTVSLDQAQSATVTVDYATADGTAVAGADYTVTSGTLTFAPGVTSQTVRVPVLTDTSNSGDLTFSLNLSNAQGAAIDTASGAGSVQELPLTTVTFSAGKPQSYVTSTGKKVTLMVRGAGAGSIYFSSAQRDPLGITLDNTTGASALTVKGTATLPSITVNGSLGFINARTATLAGAMTITGSLGKLTLGNISGTGTTISIGGAGNTVVSLGNVSDESFSTAGGISSLSVRSWSDTGANGVITLTAAAIGSLKVTGNFNADLSANGIANAKISGSITGGVWTVSSIGKLTVSGSITNAALTLNAASGLDLGTLSVSHAVSNTQIRSAAGVGKVTVGAFLSSILFAGVSDTVTDLPAAIADFSSDASILSFSLKANVSPFSFAGSDIAAAHVGKVNIAKANPSNGGVPFGIAAETLAAFSNKGVIKWTNKQASDLLLPDGDLIVRLLTT
jgi:subtilisin family serine protease